MARDSYEKVDEPIVHERKMQGFRFSACIYLLLFQRLESNIQGKEIFDLAWSQEIN